MTSPVDKGTRGEPLGVNTRSARSPSAMGVNEVSSIAAGDVSSTRLLADHQDEPVCQHLFPLASHRVRPLDLHDGRVEIGVEHGQEVGQVEDQAQGDHRARRGRESGHGGAV